MGTYRTGTFCDGWSKRRVLGSDGAAHPPRPSLRRTPYGLRRFTC
jgi:hypothetical protein